MKKQKGNKNRGSEEDAVKPEGWAPPEFKTFETTLIETTYNIAEKNGLLNNFPPKLLGPGDNDYGRNKGCLTGRFQCTEPNIEEQPRTDIYENLAAVFRKDRDFGKRLLLAAGYPGGIELVLKEIGFVREQPEATFTMSDIPLPFQESSELRKKKGEDYRSGGVVMKDYFPFGMQSYFTMINTKNLRLKSLLTSGKDPNNESIRDTLLDLMNYSCFAIEAIDKKEV
jgi:hypothetical protein